ncbi:Ig-like domain-containing protein, partial [Ramlibacter sp. PS3R-8]|uniref:Ig-like domain-containing protein n=1 Tax=Ramlibacter sp. PS3R-8 TaxID=3133437 RepID=UPI0030A9990F
MEPRVVGTVVMVEGVVLARSEDGRQRQLKVGDRVFEGEVIETMAAALVELAFAQAGRFVLRAGESVTLGAALFDSLLADNEAERGQLLARTGERTRTGSVDTEGTGEEENNEGRSILLDRVRFDDGHGFIRLDRVNESLGTAGPDGLPPTGRSPIYGVEYEAPDTPVTPIHPVPPVPPVVVPPAAPVALDDRASTREDTAVAIAVGTLLANDSDADGDVLTVVSVGSPIGGTVAIVGGTIVFTPDPDFSGTGSFVYTISDGNGGTSTATVTVDVQPAPDAPVAADDRVRTNEDTPLTIGAGTLLANDSDADGEALAVTGVSGATGGSVSIAGGNIVFVPTADFTGAGSFTYTVTDTSGRTSTATVVVDVVPVQDPPVATADNLATTEDTPVTISAASLLANDADPDSGDVLHLLSVGGAVGGTVALAGGNVTFTPAPDFTGIASFTYTIGDGNGGRSTATVTVDVAPVQDPPVARNDALTTAEDTPLTIPPATLLGNDTDPEGDPLTITAVGSAVGGTVALVGGNVVFTPATDFSGVGSFTYTVSDGQGGTDTATVTVNVTPVQDAPDARPDTVSTTEDTPITIAPATLLGNDRDADGDTLVITAVGGAVGGTVALVGGNVVFTPAPDFFGTGRFRYTVSDGNGGTDTAVVFVDVAAAQEPPVATADAFSTAEDTPVIMTVASLLANDTDPDVTDTLTVTGVSNPVGGTVTLVGGNVTFTPSPNFTGTASYDYTVSDGNGGTSTATVTVTVTPVQDPPNARNNVVGTTEDTPITIAPGTLLANDTDPDGDVLAITAVGGAIGGTVAIVGGNIVFTPNPDFTGVGSFTYTVSDGNGNTDTAIVRVNVAAAQDPPTASADSFSTAEDTPVTMTTASLLANDSDPDGGDTLTVTGVSNPVGGTVSLAGGNVVFTPAANFTGTATFDYTISDGRGGTSTATVTVNVTPVQDPPNAVNDVATTVEDTPITIAPATLLLNDSDLEGDTLTVSAVGSAVGGSVAIVGGNVVFTPAADFTGAATFQYTISDGQGNTDTATVTVNVTPVQDAPTANPNAFSTAEDTPVTMTVASLLANDTDPDAGDTLVVAGVANPVGGTVSLAGGTVTFTPDPNFTGTASYDYTISDGNGGTSTATVTINVTPAQDGPSANNDVAATTEDTPVSIPLASLAANDTDPDGDTLTVTAVGNAVGGTVVIVGGNAVFTPAADFVGAATFEYTVSDGNGGTDTGTVTVTVTAAQDAPTANANAFSTAEDTPVTMTVASLLANDTDPDAGDTLTLTGVSNPVGGSVSLAGGNVTFTPDPDFTGTATYDYTISDGNGGTSTATVTINVTPVQDAPTANNDTASTTEDTPVSISLATLSGNDTDPDGDVLTVTAVGSPVGGTVAIVGGNAVFTPAPNFVGVATFEYTVSDGNGGTDTATVTVNVTAANDAPTANDDGFSTAEDTPVVMTTASLLANDSDPDTGDTLSVTGVGNPVGGTVSLAGGNVTFTPNPNFTGTASYDYTVSDGNGGTSTATVTVNVTPVQDAPTANNDTATTIEDTPVAISLATLAGNDTDPDGDTLTVTAVGNPVGGTVVIVGGNAVFTPNPNFTGA